MKLFFTQVIKKEEKKVKVRKEPAPRITWLAAEEWQEEEEEEDAMDADGGDNVVQDPDWHSGFTPCANKKNIIKLSRAVKKVSGLKVTKVIIGF